VSSDAFKFGISPPLLDLNFPPAIPPHPLVLQTPPKTPTPPHPLVDNPPSTSTLAAAREQLAISLEKMALELDARASQSPKGSSSEPTEKNLQLVLFSYNKHDDANPNQQTSSEAPMAVENLPLPLSQESNNQNHLALDFFNSTSDNLEQVLFSYNKDQ
jgi:hypothetical protein